MKYAIPLDILTANKTENWAEEFFWPVNSLDLLTVRRDIELILYKILRKEEDELLLSILRVTYNLLVREHISLINAMLVISRLKSFGYRMDASYQSGWNGLFKGLIGTGVPQKPTFLPLTPQSKSIKGHVKSLLNTSRSIIPYMLKKRGYVNGSLLLTGGIAEEISKMSTGVFYRRDFCDFFPLKTLSNGEKNCRNIFELAEKVTGETMRYWESKQIPVIQSMKDYIYTYHVEFFYRTSCFLNSSKKTNLLRNMNIWIGSGHNFFNRVITEIVKKKEAYISCHEHGEAKALYNTTVHGYGELGLCDRFVTYTKSCAELYEKGWRDVLSLSKKIPEIDVSPIGGGQFYYSLIRKNLQNKIKGNGRKIFYVSGGFNNDANYLAWRPHDMVYFDWQSWMLKALIKAGFSVGVKYHPETLQIEKNILLGDSVEYLQGLFQDYMERDDILIFDTTCSTALQIALCGTNPIVLINCVINEMHESVLKDLAGRVEIVNGFFDNKNRFRVNLDELVSALEQCDKDKDYEFVRKYIVEF